MEPIIQQPVPGSSMLSHSFKDKKKQLNLSNTLTDTIMDKTQA